MTAPPPQAAGLDEFALSLLGGPTERQYRRARPEVEKMPWGTLDAAAYAPSVVAKARRIWTMAAYQEYRTGASCTTALGLLWSVQAPLDLLAVATWFGLDELVHVELCARILDELGGAAPLFHDLAKMGVRPPDHGSALFRCSAVIVRVFCVGEAVSIPILRESARLASHPLLGAVLRRIVKDEAAHGQFGFRYLDWALPQHTAHEIAALTAIARDEIDGLIAGWQKVAAPSDADAQTVTLGWMVRTTYFATAEKALQQAVCAPLTKRGMDPRRVKVIEPFARWVQLSDIARNAPDP